MKQSPLYLFEGKELLLREQALKSLIDETVDPSFRDFNLSQFSANKDGFEDILAAAREFPMMSSKRMIIVTDFENVNDEKELDILKDYLRSPVDSTVILFVTDGLDNRRAISTALKKACEVLSFKPPSENEASSWVREYASKQNITIDPPTASYLAGTVGLNLLKLSNEVDKLAAYLGGSGTISKKDIDKTVRYSREHSNFELTDAIIDGDRKRSLTLLDHIFTNATEPDQTLSIFILGAISSNFRRLLAAKELMNRNATNSEVAQAVGMSPYFVTALNQKARKMETAFILKSINRIAATDLALKTSMAAPRTLIEVLVCELTSI